MKDLHKDFNVTSDRFGYVSTLEATSRILRQYEVSTTTNFSVVYTKGFGKEDLGSSSKHKVYFEDPQEKPSGSRIEFDGVPFIVIGSKVLDCQHGIDRHCSSKRKKNMEKEVNDHVTSRRRYLVQKTKKFGCRAQIVMREVQRFPDYQILQDHDSEKRRKTCSKKLRAAILEGRAQGQRRFYIQFPGQEDHKGHVIGDRAGILQTTDERIKAKIRELVSDGVRDVNEMQRHVRNFVKTELFPGTALPMTTNKRFFPRKQTIRNIMYEAVVRQRFSMIDQENLEEKLCSWKQANPRDSFFFRPFMEQEYDDTTEKEEEEGDDTEEMEDDCMNKLDMQSTGLLFVHQTEWQRRLLARYGNELCLLDATYRTTKYALPLFFLVVKTNVGYQIVGSFIIQTESRANIREALAMIKEWNPNWEPKNFMVDFCEQEIKAIEDVFADCDVFICDFHREQAWERWLSTVSNGAAASKMFLLSKMRKIARARSENEFKTAVEDLKSSDVWQDASQSRLRTWFEKVWMKEHKRWVWAWRVSPERVLVSVNTNNGVERQNKAFKYQYLQRNQKCNLSTMVTILIQEFLPEKYCRYVEDNVRLSSSYRRYGRDVPAFLRNRPRFVTRHCQERAERSETIRSDDIRTIDNQRGVFQVKSQQSLSESKWHTVSFGDEQSMPSCEDCHDWEKNRLPCKHFFAVFRENADWTFQQLPAHYRNSPFISLDSDLITISPSYVSSEDDTADNEGNNFDDSKIEDETEQRLDSLQYSAIPLAKTFCRSYAATCRELLSQLKSLSYIVEDRLVLKEVHTLLEQCVTRMTTAAPRAENGLVLEDRVPAVGKSSKRVASRSSTSGVRKIKKLPVVKKKHPSTSRVGKRANDLKRTWHVDPLQSSKKVKKSSSNIEVEILTDVLDENGNIINETDFAAQTSPKKIEKTTKASKDVPHSATCEQDQISSNDAVDLESDSDSDVVIMGYSVNTKPRPKMRNVIADSQDLHIIDRNMELTDSIVSIVQNIIHSHCPLVEGLEDSAIGLAGPFSVHNGEFIQVLHNGACHWVLASNTDCAAGEVKYYDSLYHNTINSCIRRQVASMISHNQSVTIKVQAVQQQTNSVDCGVFALAFATSIIFGKDPDKMQLDVRKMRGHLSKCIKAGRMTPFPEETGMRGLRRCRSQTIIFKV